MKKSHRPQTKVIKTQPNMNSPDWIIWAAWADRITFEEIKSSYKNNENYFKAIIIQTLEEKSTFKKHQTQKKIRIL